MSKPLHLLVVALPLLICIAAFYYPFEKPIDSRILAPLLIPDEVGRIYDRVIVVLPSLD